MLRTLIRFQILRSFRSSALAERVATTGLAVLFAYLPVGALFLFGSAGLPFFLENQGIDPLAAAEKAMLPVLLCTAPFMAYFHQRVTAPLPALISRPVSRSRIARTFTITGALNLSMAASGVALLCYWATGVARTVSPVSAIAWIAATLAVLTCAHLIAHGLRIVLHDSSALFAVVSGALLAGVLADSFAGFGWTGQTGRWMFEGARTLAIVPPLTLLGAAVTLFVTVQRLQANILYLDRFSGQVSKAHPSRDGFRDLSAVLRTDLRLILRNRRVQIAALSTVITSMLAPSFFVLAAQSGKEMLLLLGCFTISAPSTQYLTLAHRARSEFMDGLAARPLPFQQLTGCAVRIADTLVAASAALAVMLVLASDPAYVPLTVGAFLYSAGVANNIGAFVSTLFRTPFDINAGMVSLQGSADGRQMLPIVLSNFSAIAPLVGFLFLVPSLTVWYVPTTLAAVGLAGIGLRPVVLSSIAAFHRRHRHRIMQRYREG